MRAAVGVTNTPEPIITPIIIFTAANKPIVRSGPVLPPFCCFSDAAVKIDKKTFYFKLKIEGQRMKERSREMGINGASKS